MREIKFRAWIDDKYDYDFCLNCDGEMMDMDCGEYVGTIPVVIIEQYTGLKDKNGKEIYEGDILQWDTPEVLCKIVKVQLFTVVWDGNGFHAKSNGDYENKYWNHISSDCEIIGNIHEERDNG